MTIGKRPAAKMLAHGAGQYQRQPARRQASAAKMLPQVTVDEPAQLGPQLQPDCGVQPVFVLAEHATAVPLHMP
jgi:hypothetical protein